jgi:hypothetical protein
MLFAISATLIPSGELKEFENPDWLIPSAALAIEVSYLLPEKPDQALFTGPQSGAVSGKCCDHSRAILS